MDSKIKMSWQSRCAIVALSAGVLGFLSLGVIPGGWHLTIDAVALVSGILLCVGVISLSIIRIARRFPKLNSAFQRAVTRRNSTR